ncbi:Phospholipid:diacylglycerol acyltransferase [Hanseniaspora uvarum DSM 2768]|nr:hypothetical protein FOG48_00102 [Hanseniaspora uvarum]KKA01033.1 Phospholipid:diacylglycerol acyltransferase [Hanseniaspora uvarum DSM 2768]
MVKKKHSKTKQKNESNNNAAKDNDNIKNTSKEDKKYLERRRIYFLIGALLGLVIAVVGGHTLSKSDSDFNFPDIDSLSSLDLFDSWTPKLAKLLPKSLLEDEIFGFSNKKKNKVDLSEDFVVGKAMKQEDSSTSAKFPVIMVPGVITTALESWYLSSTDNDNEVSNDTIKCSPESYYRKRLWGSIFMLKTMIFDKKCWLKSLKLDEETGLDPQGAKLRAAGGFEATDFFVPGYWIWNKILNNLGVLGYDSNNMLTAAYDWRLAYLDIEVRDKYFSKLKNQIELWYKTHDSEKVVLFGHSMGVQIIYYFLKWVESEGPLYGNGGDNWCNTYIDSIVDISGSVLGAPKAVPALISGEMKDTVQLNEAALYGLEAFLNKKERVDLLRHWFGIPAMLPKGGPLIWGNKTHAWDDPSCSASLEEDYPYRNFGNCSYGDFIRFSDTNETYNVNAAFDFINHGAPDWFIKRTNEQYSYGVAQSEAELEENNNHHKFWTNPLEFQLPKAPDMKIYCFYGVGNPTERSYVYKHSNATTDPPFIVDYEFGGQGGSRSVFLADGDGTLPLITHSMCHKWAEGKSPYNPGDVKVKIVELKHEPKKFDMRGGAKSAEHVDILGSAELNEYLLKIASGRGDEIEERKITDLQYWVKEMNWPF